MANTAYNTVTVTNSATLIVAANPSRKGLIITNESNVTVFIGPDSSITSANAPSLPALGNITNSGLESGFRGSIYGIVASGTADVRFWEWGQ